MKKYIAVFSILAICALVFRILPADANFASASGQTAVMTAVKVEIISSAEQKIKTLVKNMTLEQKVGQMFFHEFRYQSSGKGITEINETIKNTIKNYNIGGVVLFSENIQTAKQTTDFIRSLQDSAPVPLFIAVDEEGGRVLRTRALDVPRISAALSIGKTGDPQNAYKAAETIAGYLLPLGVNVDFAPVADIFTNPSNTVIGDRAFSSDADKAGEMVKSFTGGLLDNGILPTLKHFPGHGDTSLDSHYGAAVTKKTLAELSKCEFIPFKAGIDAGAAFVMTGHISTPNITGDNLPALFSSFLLEDVLRGTLGFKGIIITDALAMGAITNYYTPAETAVKAVSAGVDMLLGSPDLHEAYTGIIQAVKSGTITEERIGESVQRILTVKYEAGLAELPGNKTANLTACNINGSNYFKLRDLAYILNGTEKQIDIVYNEKTKTISIITGKPYTPVGGEMKAGAETGKASPVPAAVKIYVDGKETAFAAYNIGGSNYFKLNDVTRILGVYFNYNALSKTVTLDISKK